MWNTCAFYGVGKMGKVIGDLKLKEKLLGSDREAV